MIESDYFHMLGPCFQQVIVLDGEGKITGSVGGVQKNDFIWGNYPNTQQMWSLCGGC